MRTNLANLAARGQQVQTASKRALHNQPAAAATPGTDNVGSPGRGWSRYGYNNYRYGSRTSYSGAELFVSTGAALLSTSTFK